MSRKHLLHVHGGTPVYAQGPALCMYVCACLRLCVRVVCVRQEYKRVYESGDRACIAHIIKYFAIRWVNMRPWERKLYERMAEADAERYDREVRAHDAAKMSFKLRCAVSKL